VRLDYEFFTKTCFFADMNLTGIRPVIVGGLRGHDDGKET
jgi:hypothetical protein